MKKNIIRSCLTTCIIALFISCEKEPDLIEKPAAESKFVLKEYSFDQINKKPKFNISFSKVSEGLKNPNLANKSNNPDADFTIDTTNVKEITIGNYTSYTMLIIRDAPTENYFENFIVEVDSTQTIKAYIAKYTPSQEIEYVENHDSFTFNGTSEIREIEYDASLFLPEMEGNDNCVVVEMCNYGGTWHVAGEGCTNPACLAVSVSCGGGGGSGSGGVGTPVNTTNTSIVPPPIVLQTTEKKCSLFNSLKGDQVFKDLVNLLKQNTNLTQEIGYALTTVPNGYNAIPGTNNPNDNYSVQFNNIPAGTKIDILMHSHYSGGLSIFSPADLVAIYKILKDPTITTTSNFVSVVVTPTNEVYAITITDKSTFIAFGDKFLNTPGKIEAFTMTYSNKRNGGPFPAYNINKNSLPLDNEKNFVNLLQSMKTGLKLFKATPDLNQWTPLKYSTLTNSLLSEQPCDTGTI